MKVLVLGHTGKIGQAMLEVFSRHCETIGAKRPEVDALNPETLDPVLDRERPDVVINCINSKNVLGYEKDFSEAIRVHSLFPKHIAEKAAERDFTLVNFSSGAVFNPKDEQPFDEESKPSPAHLYGLAKFGGECFVMDAAPTSYIIRVGLVLSPILGAAQFFESTIRQVLDQESEVRAIVDISASVSHNYDVAEGVFDLISKKYPSGIYHMVSEGCPSRFEVLEKAAGFFDSKTRIVPAGKDEFPFGALQNDRLHFKSVRFHALGSWEDAVERCCARIKERL